MKTKFTLSIVLVSIFAFNGFQSIVQMSEEAKKGDRSPVRHIPGLQVTSQF